ncbi:MAG: hypothetical protein P8175_15970 [Deltaproteobacteria bacterium]
MGDFRGDRPSACGAPRITVLGIGNTMMGDDGVGVAVAEDLAAAGPGENVRIVTAPIPGSNRRGLLQRPSTQPRGCRCGQEGPGTPK